MADYSDNTDIADPSGHAAWLNSYTASKSPAAATRMAANATQNVGKEATPTKKEFTTVNIGQGAREKETEDWRVSLSVPSQLIGSSVLQPLGNKLIFPFNPNMLLGSSANYQSIQPVHTNHPFYAYENSQVDNITISGEFIQENERDAKYWIATLHYLRTMTKMFYGESDPLGNPPLVCRLNGYGKHVLNDIPVVITNFTTDMPQDIDYIQCEVNKEINFAPIQSIVTVSVTPQYSRRSQARFDMQKYINGQHIGSPEGFV
jgi:hypothetical protein